MPAYLIWIIIAIAALLIGLTLTTSFGSALLYIGLGGVAAVVAACVWAWLVFRNRPGAGS